MTTFYTEVLNKSKAKPAKCWILVTHCVRKVFLAKRDEPASLVPTAKLTTSCGAPCRPMLSSKTYWPTRPKDTPRSRSSFSLIRLTTPLRSLFFSIYKAKAISKDVTAIRKLRMLLSPNPGKEKE